MRKIATVLFIAFSSIAVADNNPPVNISDMTVSNLTMPTANEGTVCPGIGAVAYNFVGELLTCQSGRWSPHAPVDPGGMCGFQSNWGTTGNGCLGYNLYSQGCPPGYSLNDWHGEIGQDRRFMFCTKNN